MEHVSSVPVSILSTDMSNAKLLSLTRQFRLTITGKDNPSFPSGIHPRVIRHGHPHHASFDLADNTLTGLLRGCSPLQRLCCFDPFFTLSSVHSPRFHPFHFYPYILHPFIRLLFHPVSSHLSTHPFTHSTSIRSSRIHLPVHSMSIPSPSIYPSTHRNGNRVEVRG